MLFFLLGGVFALLMGTQLAQPNMQFVSDNSHNELFTMHGSTMIFLFVTPMAIAMAMYLVPLQIGAVRASAPRLALIGFWTWLSGGLIMESSWLTADGAGRDGWSSYAPMSNSTNTPGVGQDLWVIGVILVAAGMTFMAACLVATVARRRVPAMSLLRVPVFTWTALVSVLMVVGSFPILVLAMVLLYIDRHGGHIYEGFAGSIDYQDLFGFFGHPVVYVMLLIGGSIVLRTSMLFGLSFFLQFLIGGLSGIFVASPVLDYHAYGTCIVVAHFHYTLFAWSIFGFFAGVYHWFPKLTGALLRERLGKLQLLLMVVGTNLTFFPMFFLGNDGMPRRVSRYPTHPSWGTLNLLETIGSGIAALGVLAFLVNV